jgi:Flp pilus assembly protein TadG
MASAPTRPRPCRDGGRRCGIVFDRRGATMVEFAFIAPVLLVLLLGAIEIARFHFTRSALESAAAATMRVATIDPGADEASLRAVLRDNLEGFTAGRLGDLTVSRVPEPGTSLVRIDIRATVVFEPIVTLILPETMQIETTTSGIALQ